VEEALYGIRGWRRVAVFGLPHPVWVVQVAAAW
jgi:acyl-CoA synthetase (AMP-forming)/AMP-acid ligase II